MTKVTDDPKKRSFLTVATGAMLGVGACAAAWPLVRQMSPSADVETPIEIEYSGLKEGESKLLRWRGNPLLLRHRTGEEIEQTRSVEVETLRDRFARNSSLAKAALATVENRSFGPDGRYVVMVPICTHMGCLLSQEAYRLPDDHFTGGFSCACHGAQFDSLGRVYGGPANTNLVIPSFTFNANRLMLFPAQVPLT